MNKLFRLNDDKYLILYANGSECEGSKIKVIASMVNNGFEEDEIFNGLNALEVDDVAEYGIYKTFIFSKKLVA